MPEKYNYATIEITHRLNVNKPINHEVITLNKVIRTGIEIKYNISCTQSWYELQILYRDENNKVQCGNYNLDEYRFKIINMGDFKLCL